MVMMMYLYIALSTWILNTIPDTLSDLGVCAKQKKSTSNGQQKPPHSDHVNDKVTESFPSLFSTGFKIPEVPPCQIQLGMQNGKLPDSVITASSQLNAYYGPANARLHFQGASGRYPSWIPAKNNFQQWLQVDFGVETQVTRIETQGNHDHNYWVKTYTLRYSLDGLYFYQYQPHSGVTKVSSTTVSLLYCRTSP